MEFSVQGTATPRNFHRHLPGSARGRPQSGKSNINPITGEDIVYMTPRKPVKQPEPRIENKGGVPSLNLKYLHDDDEKTGAIDIDLNDYSLDTPGSASTVSWGTGRSGLNTAYKKPPTGLPQKSSQRPDCVPKMKFGDGDDRPQSTRVAKKKQPTAWDADPVPTDLPAPSARQKELYKQYEEEMKQSYRAGQGKTTQNEVNEAVERIRSARQTTKKQEDLLAQKAALKEEAQRLEADRKMEESWVKERYTGQQLAKKADAEYLLEQNKKQKLVETVMIDQLSRAVISDPEQNQRTTARDTLSGRARGSNRYLHESKVSTTSTATENLLSKRVCFGARILTRNGHDAMRELTGFYFHFDKSITVYEFRQFGKSAKAMPFIYRGQYLHKSGPKQGLPYSLSDIYTGGNLRIPTEGQLALNDSLSESNYITLRITDVDETEKERILEATADESARLHAPSRMDMENREYLYIIQDQVQDKIRKRAIRTLTGLGRYYRKLDQYETGILDQYDLEKGLKTFRIDLEPEQLEEVFDILDPEGMKLLDYQEYMRNVIGEMNEFRKALVRKAFQKLDCHKNGMINVIDVKKFFNVNSKYRSSAGEETGTSALQAFLDAVRENEKQETISFIEFEEYYEGLSIGIDSDEDFANVLRNTWSI